MGAQGTRTSISGGFVFDAGGLIAFEKGDQFVRALIARAPDSQLTVVIPASALAQVWRGGPRSASLAWVIASAESDALDEARAKEVGERLGDRLTTDVADAHVVCCALEHRAVVVTSDPDGMKALTEPGERLTVVPV